MKILPISILWIILLSCLPSYSESDSSKEARVNNKVRSHPKSLDSKNNGKQVTDLLNSIEKTEKTFDEYHQEIIHRTTKQKISDFSNDDIDKQINELRTDIAATKLASAEQLEEMGTTLVSLGRFKEAMSALKLAIDLKSKYLGAQHLGTTKTMIKLADLYKTQNQYSESEALLKKVLDIRKRILGDNHPETLDVRKQLDLLYHVWHGSNRN